MHQLEPGGTTQSPIHDHGFDALIAHSVETKMRSEFWIKPLTIQMRRKKNAKWKKHTCIIIKQQNLKKVNNVKGIISG